MIHDKTISTIEWTDERLKEIESVVNALDQAIEDYLQWMTENGYAKSTRKEYARVLRWFKLFIKKRKCLWDEIFTQEMLRQFKKSERPYPIHAVTGLSRYLFEQGKIARHLGMKDQSVNLPQIYEDYLIYHQKTHQASNRKLKHIKVVLIAFHKFLEKHRIKLRTLTIEKIDAFLSEYFVDYKENTCRVYRSYLRGFLRYLFHEQKLLPSNLAPLIVGAPQFSKAKPPNFLRPHELKRLFASLKLSSTGDLRAYAMVHLAYTLGLRPCEISSIRLDDIFFKDAALCIRIRKNDKPVRLPVPEETIKAMAAYLIGGRPKSKQRRVFLTLQPPYRPMLQNAVTQNINNCMKKIGIPYSAYCLRHTYAQNLLEAGLSIYEIKEMMGHDSIESTRKYLHVHTKLMREVLFDETLSSYRKSSKPIPSRQHQKKGLNDNRVRCVFGQALKDMEIDQSRQVIGRTNFSAPTVHSLRHSFAVNTLKRVQARGRSPQNALPVLATYMGHSEYKHTIKYLKMIDAKKRKQFLDFSLEQKEKP